MSDDTMIKDCAKVGLSRGCGIEPPEWVNKPKKQADVKEQENPVPMVKIELYFELSDDLKNARCDRNLFAGLFVIALAMCVCMSYALWVW